MSLDPEELLKHASRLAADDEALQTDLRRALSAAYYAVFHFASTAAADTIFGEAARTTQEYLLVYRSIDHGRLVGLCKQLFGTKPAKDISINLPNGFGEIAEFARLTHNLYQLRIKADYIPGAIFSASEVRLEISNAQVAIKSFNSSTSEQRAAFLAMLLFKSRKEGQTP